MATTCAAIRISHVVYRRWSSLSYAYYKRLLESGDTVEAGVKRLSGYSFSNKEFVSVREHVLGLC